MTATNAIKMFSAKVTNSLSLTILNFLLSNYIYTTFPFFQSGWLHNFDI